ncbi:hypothetical protein SMICM17S_04719 [Streptomyces microflavus]
MPNEVALAVVAVAYWYSRIRQPLVDGVAAQVGADTAEDGAITYLGRARVLPPRMIFSEITVVVEFSVGRNVRDSCQAVAAGSTLVNTEVDPFVSFKVKEPASVPVKVRPFARVSGFHPPLVVAVNPISAPATSTTASEVAEVGRT